MSEETKMNRGYLDLSKPSDLSPMSQQESEIFVVLTMQSQARKAKGVERTVTSLQTEEGFPGHPLFSILVKRLENPAGGADRIVEPEALLMIVSLDSNDRPGVAVMWAYTLTVLAAELGKPVSLEDLADPKAFGHGFPSLEAMRWCWQSQKQEDGSNGLDGMPFWRPVLELLNA